MVERARILEYAQAIAREFQPEKIILFGSYAYGEPTPDSDVDLLVVMRHEENPARKAAEIEIKLRTGFPLDLIVRTPDAMRERVAIGDCFMREIIERGQLLHEGRDAKVA